MQRPQITQNVVQQNKTDTGHDAPEHIGGNASRAEVQVGKGQGQYHHHQTAQWVKNLLPKLDFVLLGGLPIGLQVADVLEKINGAHAFGPQYGGGHHFGAELGGPAKTVHRRSIHPRGTGIGAGEFGVVHLFQQPGLVLVEFGGLTLGHGD